MTTEIAIKILDKIGVLIDTGLMFIHLTVGFVAGVTVSMLVLFVLDKDFRKTMKEPDK